MKSNKTQSSLDFSLNKNTDFQGYLYTFNLICLQINLWIKGNIFEKQGRLFEKYFFFWTLIREYKNPMFVIEHTLAK